MAKPSTRRHLSYHPPASHMPPHGRRGSGIERDALVCAALLDATAPIAVSAVGAELPAEMARYVRRRLEALPI